MKNIRLIIISLFSISTLAGCDLTSLNENYNEPTIDVDYNLNDPSLAAALRNGLAMEGDDEQRVKSLMIDFYAQIADGGGQVTKNYMMFDKWEQRVFTRVQSTVSALNIVINNLSLRGDDFINSIAIAKIWRVYVQATGTDFFGPIPFSPYKDPLYNPPYVSVKDTYYEFFRELDEAIELIDRKNENTAFIKANSDALYKNDMNKWRKFANSLKLRYALRLSEVDEAKCKEEAAKAVASGVFESREDNAYMPPRNNGVWGQKYNYPMFQGWSSINMTTTFEKLLTNIGGIDFPTNIVNKWAAMEGTNVPVSSIHPEKADPRATQMWDPARTTGDWIGLTVGLASGTSIVRENFSEMGFLVKNGAKNDLRPYDLMLYEEICFLKAEAALRGFINGDAKTEYEKGVRASFATWGVSNLADDYLASTEKNRAGTSANFDDFSAGNGNTQLEKIITQKYIAAFPDISMESWCDKRRLNLPRFDVPDSRDESIYNNSNKNILDPTNFIKRVQYPNLEQQINKEEYDKGVQLLEGPDKVNTPLWWDLNKNYCTSAE